MTSIFINYKKIGSIFNKRKIIYFHYLFANCEETHARPHFKFVNINFKAFVHCSSELN